MTDSADAPPLAFPKVTLDLIASRAGVSRATVDRVLHGRAPVRPGTRDAVLAARAELLGVQPFSESTPAPQSKAIKIALVLPKDRSGFLEDLSRHFGEAAEALGDVQLNALRFQSGSTGDLVATLQQVSQETDGLAVLAVDHPLVRQELLRLRRAGIKIVTVASDVDVQRVGYVGIDNRNSGRLAGFLMDRMLPPGRHELALLRGSTAFRGQEEREMGFRHYIAETSRLSLVRTIEMREAIDEIIGRHPSISGFYNTSIGNRRVARALLSAGRADEMFVIGHDLTEHTRSMLLSGVMDIVIDQSPHEQARTALDLLKRSILGEEPTAPMVRTQIICVENLPDEM